MYREKFVFSQSVKGLEKNGLEIDLNSDDVDTIGDAFFYKDIPFTGIWYIYYPNGKIAELSHYLGGLPHGETTEWHENGHLKSKVNFVQSLGTLGNRFTWYANGVMERYEKVAYGIVLAIKEWDEKGNLIKNWSLDPHDSIFDRAISNRKYHIDKVKRGLVDADSLSPWTSILGLPEV